MFVWFCEHNRVPLLLRTTVLENEAQTALHIQRFAIVLYHRCLTGQQGIGTVPSACRELGVEATAEKSTECSLTVDLRKRANARGDDDVKSAEISSQALFCAKHGVWGGHALLSQ